jgi:tetraacyldisaccharide 4'-kinase
MSLATQNTLAWDGIPALTPLSWVYRGGVSIVRALRTPGRPVASTPRVVSVGNLEVGGSGKTPLCLLLLERALRAGKRVAYASRGFGSAAERGPLVTVVLAEGAPPPVSFAGLRLVARHHHDLANAIGDEAAMVARRLPAATLVFAGDKRRAAAAAARLHAELVVVDDAFQSFALARHLDVVLLDARRPLANGHVLPAGRLREAPSAIARADVVVFNGASDARAIEEARAHLARRLRPRQHVFGLRRTLSLVPSTAVAAGAPTDAVLVSGIARPDDFRSSVAAAGVRVADAIVFRDHHRYSIDDALAIRTRARGRGIVTTEKDWVKLERYDWGETPVWVARLDVALVGAGADDASWLLG